MGKSSNVEQGAAITSLLSPVTRVVMKIYHRSTLPYSTNPHQSPFA